LALTLAHNSPPPGRAIYDTSGILRCTSATTASEITVIPVTATTTQTTTTPAAQTSQVASPVPSHRARPRAAMFAGIFCGLAVIQLILVIVILFLCRRSRRRTEPDLEPVQYTMVDRSSHEAMPPLPDSANSKARRPRKADAGSGNMEQPPSTIIPL